MTTIRRWTMLLAAACVLGAPAAHATTVVLDKTTGADYDAVGDGGFFATPPAPPDGAGDLEGNLLAIGFIDGVLNLRAMAEFALTPLAGVDPADIESATLTVTIDDVISMFWPGDPFGPTASDPFEVWSYEGDGTVTLPDFAPPDAALIESVPTGGITDATLAVTGAQSFHIDVTEHLRNAVDFEFAAFGVQITTVDHQSSASLDDQGVPGAKFPFITVEIADAPATTTSTVAPSSTTSTSLEPGATTSTSLAPETTTTTSSTTSTSLAPATTTSTSVAPATTTSTSVAPATTTSTSVVPASTTSTSLAPATTTTTSTAPASTTSTTVPPGCGDDATIESITCRADELAEKIVANQAALGSAYGKLRKQMTKIGTLLDGAAAAIDANDTKKAKSALRKVGGRYRALGRPLRSKTGRNNIDEALRNALLAAIDDLRADSKALMQSL